ncbi:phospho-sugar mutase [Gordonia sp. VNK21]|uniref:phospho-sugar mutase n=1 Tax=Gordonia sp. VNK21 TaxID=3382483 RepID=UPI0038D4408F
MSTEPMRLRFGTAGLRGPVGDGPDAMNVPNVVTATAGLAAWLGAHGRAGGTVVVGRDARHGSAEFATAAAEVLAAAGFDVVLLPEPGPTPLVAFATRRLAAVAGVMITASHNPPADNGYKVYLDGGAQLISPADSEIEEQIGLAGDPARVARRAVTSDRRAQAVLPDYLARLRVRFGRPAAAPLRIALTPMHGVGGATALAALTQAGVTDVRVVDAQFTPDPDFPTVAFPNPEEPGATDLLLELARNCEADLAIALDPDADRCAVGVPVGGRWRMLTGDETGALLGDAVLDEYEPFGAPAPVVASSIVSGTLLDTLARARGADARRTLTGFKHLVRAGEPLVYAYEEALGHCVDPEAVRDKDGISAAVALSLLAAERKRAGTDLAARLDELAAVYGPHRTAQRSRRLAGQHDLDAVMARLRSAPPAELGGILVQVRDFADGTAAGVGRLRTDAVELSGSSADGVALRIVVRPSGTEPKIKFCGQVSAAPGTAPEGLNGLLARALKALSDE